MICPICKKPAAPAYRPFCSRRCADVDLGKWLAGSYAVPADSPNDLDEAARALSELPPKPH
ncbi:DNA gyrase inhibitor YacG [Rhodovulum strictum]|uniref:DNA gyrase inhibitor YacG n=1 Tax=Rhodovulum strictum TaxID=58314 RepID=A0A844BK18_9RHOB|nr:DNA gyrase inhibitor YacG [Rhodovulum strictum]MRH22889.1 DNA gyrase inhibitor YacG [Rhodovulum strictum]